MKKEERESVLVRISNVKERSDINVKVCRNNLEIALKLQKTADEFLKAAKKAVNGK